MTAASPLDGLIPSESLTFWFVNFCLRWLDQP
jgi:hypothetical protein